MATLRDIRRRLVSVEKTQQITRAMRMVAAAKLRRAQDAILAARPYAKGMRDTLSSVAASQRDVQHPLLEVRETVSRVEFLVVTSNRGLCGGFNSNPLKFAEQLVAARVREDVQVEISTAGKKARDFFQRHRRDQLAENYPQEGWVDYGQAAAIARRLETRFAEGEVDEVWLVYNEFISPMTQRPRDVKLLPFAPESGDDGEAIPHEIEPSPAQLLAVLVPKAVEVEIYRALLENQAGEHAARMAAMESATRNTEELIDALALKYNRARQATITRELVEIVTGAEAL